MKVHIVQKIHLWLHPVNELLRNEKSPPFTSLLYVKTHSSAPCDVTKEAYNTLITTLPH